MNEIEKIEQRLFEEDIQLDYMQLNEVVAFSLNIDKKNYICMNSSAVLTSTEKKCILEHEYSHIKTDAFYSVYNKKTAIKRRELKANDDMITRLGLVEPVLLLLKKQSPKWEIAEELGVTEFVVDHCIDYIMRKDLK